MADQEISIQINTQAGKAVSGLDRITASLERIEAAIAPIEKALGTISGIGKSAAESLGRLSRAVDGINSGKLRELSGGLEAASKTASRAGGSIAKAMSGIGDGSDKASEKVRKMSKELADSFNIKSKEGLEAVTVAMQDLNKASSDFVKSGSRNLPQEESDALYETLFKNVDALNEVIREYGRFENVVDDAAKSVREFVSAQKDISLKNISRDFADDFSRMRAVLGKGFSNNGTVGFDSFIKELNETLGTKFDEAVPSNAFEELVHYLEDARGGMLSFGDAVQKGIASMDSIKEATKYYSVEIIKLNQQLERAYGKTEPRDDVAVGIEGSIPKIQKLSEELNRYKAIVRDVEKARPDADYEGYDEAVRKVNELTESLKRYKKLALASKAVAGPAETPKAQDPFKETTSGAEKAFETIREVNQEVKNVSDSLGELPDMSRKASAVLGKAFDRKPAEDVARIIREAFEDIPDFSEIIGNDKYSDAFQKNAAWMQQSLERLNQLDEALQEHEATIRKVGDEYGALANKASAGIKGRRLQDEIKEAANEVANYKEQLKFLQDSGKDVSSAWKKAQEKINNVSHVLEQLKPISDEAREKLSQAFVLDGDGYTKAYKSVAYDYEKTLEYLQQLEDKRNELENMPGARLIDFEALEKETEKANAYLDRLEDRMNKMERLDLDFVQPKQKSVSEEKVMDKKPALEFMATIVALQHELEKVSQVMNRFGDIAASAFKKAFAPLKLARLEFDAIKAGVQRVGSSFAMISKPITKIFGSVGSGLKEKLKPAESIFPRMSASADRAFAKIWKGWTGLAKRFSSTAIRKAINEVFSTMGEATKSLAKFSSSIGTDFNRSMSVLTSDFRYVGASIAAAFSPILNAVMPVLDKLADAVVGVLNKVNMFLAALTGANSFTIAKKRIVDYTGALEDASKAAKSFTLGIDELNVLNEAQAASTGTDDLFDWEELPAEKIPEGIKKIADAVKKAAKDLFAPIRQAWDNAGDYVVDSFKFMADELKKLFKDIWRDFIDVWNQPETVAMLTEILEIFGDIMRIVGTIAQKLREAWNYNELGKRILEQIRDIFAVIVHHIHEMTQETLDWAQQLTFIPLFESFLYLLEKLKHSLDGVLSVVNDIFKDVILPVAKWFIESGLPQINFILADIVEAVGNLAWNFDSAWNTYVDGARRGETVGQNFIKIFDTILADVKEISSAIKEWSVGIDFGPLLDAFIELQGSVRGAFDSIGDVVVDSFNTSVLPMLEKILEDTLPRFMVFVSDIIGGIGNIANKIDEAWKKLDFGKSLFEGLSGIIDGLLVHIENVGKAFREWGSQLNFEPVMKALDGLMQSMGKVAEFIGGVFEDIMKDAVMPFVKYMLETAWPSLTEAFSNFANAIHWDALRKKLDEIWKAVEHAAEAFNTGLIQAIDSLGQKVAGFVNSEPFQQFLDNIAYFLDRITPEMVKNVFEGLGTAILHIADSVVKFVNSDLFQGFLNKLLDFMNQSPEKIASILEKIAVAIVGFKFAAFIGEGLAGFLSFIGAIKSAYDMASQIKLLKDIADNVKGIGINAEDAGVKTALFTQTLGKISPVVQTIISTVGGVISIVAGVFTAVSGLWDMLKNGFSWLGEAKLAIGLGIAALGATFLGVPATVSAVVAGVILLVGNLVVGLKNHWDDIVNTVHDVWNGIKDFFGNIWQGIKDLAGSIFGGLRDFFTSIWDGISGAWSAIWNAITGVLSGLWNGIIGAAHNIWDGITGFFSGLWDGIMSLWDTIWGGISTMLSGIWNAISGAGQMIWNGIANFFTGIWDSIKGAWSDAWNGIKELVSSIWDSIKNTAETVWNSIKGFFSGLWDGVKDIVKGIADKFKETISEAVNFAKEFVQKGIDAAADFVKEFWNGLKELPGKMLDIGKNIVEGIWKGIASAKDWLMDKLKNSVAGKMVSSLMAALGEHSPSKVMADEVGSNVTLGIWEGIKDEFPALLDNTKKELSALTSMMKSTMESSVAAISHLTSQITDQLQNMIGILQKFMESFISIGTTAVKEFAGGFAKSLEIMADKSTSIGENIATGISKGLNNKWTWLTGKVGDLANSLLDAAKQTLGINSPSKVFANVVGRSIPEGIEVGFKKAMPELISTMNGELGGMAGLVSLSKIGIPMYAMGGFVPEDGLFYANHNEMVGRFSNGRTAVANNDIITESIRDAVVSGMSPYLSEIARNTRETADKDLTVSIGDRDIARSANRGKSQLGRSLVTVG